MSSIAVVLVVTVVAVKATTLVLPLIVVTAVGSTGTLDATNLVANVVDVVISDDDFKVLQLAKRKLLQLM